MNIKTDKQTAEYLLELLDRHQEGYSIEYAPERIVKLREFIETVKVGLHK